MKASILLTVALTACQTQVAQAAKTVWAHFMVSNTKGYTKAHWEYEMQRAKDVGIDGFALNMGWGENDTTPGLPNAFAAAKVIGVQLFLSLDYAGNGAWPQKEASAIINKYKKEDAYFYYNGKPLVSTFEGPSKSEDWKLIKPETGCFFIPSFSSYGAKKAVGTGVVDGLFSWGAWYDGPFDMHTEVDESYREFLKGKPYMMPVSPWFFTNMPGFRKNWLWRGDDMWYDRWIQVLSIQPEFVQIISWNDYGESHYIGPAPRLSSGYEAFGPTRGKSPFNYGTLPHDGWRVTARFWINLYKNGVASVNRESVVAWYRQTEASLCASGGTTGNTATQLQTTYPPGQLAQDKIFFDAILGSTADVTVTIGGVSVPAKWENVPEGNVGVFHGSVSFKGLSGPVVVSVVRGGSTVVQATGPNILTSCTIQNWNAVVAYNEGPTIATKSTPADSLKYCTSGRGRGFLGLVCQTACKYSYCPTVCTCTSRGSKSLPYPKGPDPPVVGCPNDGFDVRFLGLCNMTVGIGQGPTNACQKKPYGTKCVEIPVAEPQIPVCKAGTAEGTYKELCIFTCQYNFCPPDVCMCTLAGMGGLNPPPSDPSLAPGVSKDGKDFGLCSWACSRGFCDETACKREVSGIQSFSVGSILFERSHAFYQKDLDICYNDWNTDFPTNSPSHWMTIPCSQAVESLGNEKRWENAKADAAFAQVNKCWEYMKKYGYGLTAIENNEWSKLVFPFFTYGQQNAICSYVGKSQGTTCNVDKQCKNNQAAGYLIANSLAMIRVAHDDLMEAVQNAWEKLRDQKLARFVATFCPEKEETKVFEVLFGLVGSGLSLAGGPVWENLLSTFVKGDTLREIIKEGVSAAVEAGLAEAEGLFDQTDSALMSYTDFVELGSRMTEAWTSAINSTNYLLFTTDDGFKDALKIVQGGNMLKWNGVPNVTTGYNQAFFSQLLPIAWSKSGQGHYPFILKPDVGKEGVECRGWDVSDYLTDENKLASCACIDNQPYCVISSEAPGVSFDPPGCGGTPANPGAPPGQCDPVKFRLLPGVKEHLAPGKENEWGDFGIEQIIRSSIESSKNPDMKYPALNFTSFGKEALGRAGVFRLPICTGSEARKYGDKASPNFPCKPPS